MKTSYPFTFIFSINIIQLVAPVNAQQVYDGPTTWTGQQLPASDSPVSDAIKVEYRQLTHSSTIPEHILDITSADCASTSSVHTLHAGTFNTETTAGRLRYAAPL